MSAAVLAVARFFFASLMLSAAYLSFAFGFGAMIYATTVYGAMLAVGAMLFSGLFTTGAIWAIRS